MQDMTCSLMAKIKYNLRYLGNPKWDRGISPPELLNYIKKSKLGHALDLGCGTGTNLITLGKNGWNVKGIDFACLAVHKARKRLRDAGIVSEVYCRSVVKIDFIATKFDLVLDIGCFHGLNDKEKQKYIQNLDHLLKSNGTLMIYGFLSQQEFKSGISEAHINVIREKLKLANRTDGYDDNGRRSTWLLFCK